MSDTDPECGTKILSARHKELELERLQAVQNLRLAGAELARVKAAMLMEIGEHVSHW